MSESKIFSNQVAFVTGAGSGIGQATAIAFAQRGANVVVIGRRASNLEDTVAQITRLGGRALAIACDVSKENEVEAALAKTIETFGRLDFAFNNAGIEQDSLAMADLATPVWQQIIDINLTGMFLCMKHQIPLLLKSGGAIVNTASGAGVKGFAKQAGYCASKFGLIGLTKAAALDYAEAGIRINAIAPGIIETPMMQRFTGGTEEGRKAAIAQEPVGRAGRPEEIAGTVMYLCSPAGAFTTGATLVVDGGQTV